MTYLALNAAFLVAALVVAVVSRRRAGGRPGARAVLVTVAALFVLTAVFDNVMIGVGLFDYSAEHRSGLSIGLAPVEDFAYPLAGALLLPGLWHLLRPRPHDPGSARGGKDGR